MSSIRIFVLADVLAEACFRLRSLHIPAFIEDNSYVLSVRVFDIPVIEPMRAKQIFGIYRHL